MRKGIKKFIGIASTVAILTSGVANRYNDISNKEYTYYNCLPLECEDDNRIVCSFNIDEDLQRYIINLCKDNEYITPELLYAIMSYVSNYDKTLICGKKYYGLMQVDKQYFDMLEVTTDLEVNEQTILWSYTNVRCGYELLNTCIEYFIGRGYTDRELLYVSLSAYGRGTGYTEECLKNTDGRCEYSENIMAMYDYILAHQYSLSKK